MAQLTRAALKTKFNDLTSGLFKPNTTKAINSERMRTNTDDLSDSAVFREDMADLDHYRGVYDLSLAAYPSSGGTGAAGIPADGDYWIGGNTGVFDVQGFDDPIDLFRGAMLYYIGGTVSDPNSWVVKQ